MCKSDYLHRQRHREIKIFVADGPLLSARRCAVQTLNRVADPQRLSATDSLQLLVMWLCPANAVVYPLVQIHFLQPILKIKILAFPSERSLSRQTTTGMVQ